MEKLYEDEVKFKKDLDVLGFRFGDRFSHVGFVISYIDSRSGAEISQIACSTPINACRVLPSIIEQKKLNAEDIKIICEFVYDVESRDCADISCEISPYMYFKKTEEKKLEENKEN